MRVPLLLLLLWVATSRSWLSWVTAGNGRLPLVTTGSGWLLSWVTAGNRRLSERSRLAWVTPGNGRSRISCQTTAVVLLGRLAWGHAWGHSEPSSWGWVAARCRSSCWREARPSCWGRVVGASGRGVTRPCLGRVARPSRSWGEAWRSHRGRVALTPGWGVTRSSGWRGVARAAWGRVGVRHCSR